VREATLEMLGALATGCGGRVSFVQPLGHARRSCAELLASMLKGWAGTQGLKQEIRKEATSPWSVHALTAPPSRSALSLRHRARLATTTTTATTAMI
jgi:hypothetical protein